MYEIFKNKFFLKDTMKKVTWLFPLHPLNFYGQNFEKQKFLELVTSLFDLQDILTKIHFLILPFESRNCEKRNEKRQKIEYIEGKKAFFNIFKMLSLVKYEK